MAQRSIYHLHQIALCATFNFRQIKDPAVFVIHPMRKHIGGAKYTVATSKLSISRNKEIFLNQARCDLLFRSHFFAHNFANMPYPQFQCGHRSQTTSHVFFTCPLLNDVRRTFLTEIRSIPNFDIASLETLSLAERVYLLLHGGSDLVAQI
jgi:hypothetical protein